MRSSALVPAPPRPMILTRTAAAGAGWLRGSSIIGRCGSVVESKGNGSDEQQEGNQQPDGEPRQQAPNPCAETARPPRSLHRLRVFDEADRRRILGILERG